MIQTSAYFKFLNNIFHDIANKKEVYNQQQ